MAQSRFSTPAQWSGYLIDRDTGFTTGFSLAYPGSNALTSTGRIMAAVRGLPYALFSLPAGALANRWDRKRVMILCDAGRALALGSIPLAMLLGHLTILQLYLVSLVEGSLFVFFQMAESSALPHIITKEQLTTATGQNEVLFSSSILILFIPQLILAIITSLNKHILNAPPIQQLYHLP
jgi:MFS family permease